MTRKSLDTMPPEILHQICSVLLEQKDKPSVVSLCLVCKRVQPVATAAVFRRLTPIIASTIKVEMRGWCLGDPKSSLPGLLRTVVTNREIASAVREIDFFTRGRSNLTKRHLRLVKSLAAALGVEIPRSLSRGQALTCITELISLHLPNLRRLRYEMPAIRGPDHLFQPEEPSIEGVGEGEGLALAPMQIFRAASLGQQGRPPLLLSRLEDVSIDEFGPVETLPGLASAAPNLGSLWLRAAHGPVADASFSTVTTLTLTCAGFTGQELEHLLRGFPSLRKFRFAWGTPGKDRGREKMAMVWCSPQQAVDALGPLKAQLRELKLGFGNWMFCHWAMHDPSLSDPGFHIPPGLLESMEEFTSLDQLDIDESCLWAMRRKEERESTESKVDYLISILPAGLKKLGFEGLDDDVGDRGLSLFAGRVKQRCPQLQAVLYHFDLIGAIAMKPLEAVEKRLGRLYGPERERKRLEIAQERVAGLRGAFADQGIAFDGDPDRGRDEGDDFYQFQLKYDLQGY